MVLEDPDSDYLGLKILFVSNYRARETMQPRTVLKSHKEAMCQLNTSKDAISRGKGLLLSKGMGEFTRGQTSENLIVIYQVL